MAISFHHQRCLSKSSWDCAAAAPAYGTRAWSSHAGTPLTGYYTRWCWERGLKRDTTWLQFPIMSLEMSRGGRTGLLFPFRLLGPSAKGSGRTGGPGRDAANLAFGTVLLLFQTTSFTRLRGAVL